MCLTRIMSICYNEKNIQKILILFLKFHQEIMMYFKNKVDMKKINVG